MSEEEKRLKRCCFTGHRPEKLNMMEFRVKMLLKAEIKRAISDGYVTFISGMARGIDMWSAEIVLNLKKKNPDLHLICALPHRDFESRWGLEEQRKYREILEQADLVRYINENYFRACYQRRNEWMVNHSNRVIAAFNGELGGTKNTIDYAKKIGLQIINILNHSI